MDYTENEGKVTSFDFVVADWGASGHQDTHFGGTPVYASGNAFNKSSNKDIFAFGRIAAELYLPESGNLTKYKKTRLFYGFILLKLKRLAQIKLFPN